MMDLLEHKDFQGIGYDPVTGLFYWTENKGRISKGTKCGSYDHGYLMVRYQYKPYRLHRLAFLFVHGYMPRIIDHINRIRDDNRIINLRDATDSQNNANRAKRGGLTSRYAGVCWDSWAGKWRAEVSKDGKNVESRRFSCEHEAARWRDEKVIKYYGEFAYLNDTTIVEGSAETCLSLM
jgi:hypothetical protein